MPEQQPTDTAVLRQTLVESFFGVIGAPDDTEVVAHADRTLAALDTIVPPASHP